MTDQAENAALLVAGVAIEIGKLAVEMADVAGDVQRVSRLVDGQAELFGGLRQSTDTIVASNQHIAEKAAETRACRRHAAMDATKNSHLRCRQNAWYPTFVGMLQQCAQCPHSGVPGRFRGSNGGAETEDNSMRRYGQRQRQHLNLYRINLVVTPYRFEP